MDGVVASGAVATVGLLTGLLSVAWAGSLLPGALVGEGVAVGEAHALKTNEQTIATQNIGYNLLLIFSSGE